jgi:uncharacterized LabA/DUF88 family protein
MLWNSDGKLVRIAVFFDGGYFDEVSRFYKFQHARKARLSVQGIQAFIRDAVANREKTDESYCQIVEAHYFRGRFSASDAAAAGKLEDQAAFDDILIRAGIVQHYLPMRMSQGRPQEMGIDVWLSLEAFDLAVHKRFDVLALIGCDADYVPLTRKLSGIGTRTMVLAWDFQYEFTDAQGAVKRRETRTAQALIEACTYPVMMTAIVDDRSKKDDAAVRGLFV